MRHKAHPFGWNWPKDKPCNHPDVVPVHSSPGWGCATDRIKMTCVDCGKVVRVVMK